jgi:MscS family membrane protein
MKRYLLTPCLFILSFLASAQAREELFDYNLNSPYDTIITHLGFLKEGNYYPEIAAKTFCQKYRSQQEAARLAIQLQHLLQENQVDIALSQVPKDIHYVDPQAKYHKYQLTDVFPEIYLVKVNNKWIYSEETVRSIAMLSQENRSPWVIKKLRHLLPNGFSKKLFGLQIWQYTLLLCLSLLATFPYRITIFMSPRWLLGASKHCDPTHVRRVKKFTGFLMAVLTVLLTLPIAQLPATVEQSTIRFLKGVSILTITAVCYQWVNVLMPQINKRHTKNTRHLNEQLVLLAQPFMKVLVALTGILLTLKALNFNISNMLAGISIGGIGFALASQDTIKNFFGTLTIFIDQPFGVGDTIVTGNVEGIVEEIGLRATRIRTCHQSVVYIPNAKLIDTHIDNHGLRSHPHFDVHVAIAYDTKPTLIKDLVEGLNKIAAHHTRTQEDKHAVYLEGMQNTTLKVLLRVYFVVDSQYGELQCRHEVLSEITDLAEKLGIHLVSLA